MNGISQAVAPTAYSMKMLADRLGCAVERERRDLENGRSRGTRTEAVGMSGRRNVQGLEQSAPSIVQVLRQNFRRPTGRWRLCDANGPLFR